MQESCNHDAHQRLIDSELAEGDLVYHQQRRIGKLLPRAEGPAHQIGAARWGYEALSCHADHCRTDTGRRGSSGAGGHLDHHHDKGGIRQYAAVQSWT